MPILIYAAMWGALFGMLAPEFMKLPDADDDRADL
jgi:hypothetical protein